MKVLFIGGTGIISSACAQLAMDAGIEVTLLNRGQSQRPVPEGAEVLQADIRKPGSVREVLKGRSFDSIINWITFTPQHVETDIELFSDHTQQYIFISSASVYQKPPARLPIVESSPLHNPFWEYSRNKIACEERLIRAYREAGFPITIVRPSHTYDKTLLPFDGGYTVLDRIRRGEKVVVHGDGTSLWVLTHHRDFAKGFTGLIGNPHALGEVFHITSDELLTWNQIYEIIAKAAGVEVKKIHIPSEVIARYDAEWGASLLGDKTHSVIFDNSKIKRLVPEFKAVIPFSRGVEEILAWYDGDKARQKVDEKLNRLMDRMIVDQEGIQPV